MAALGMIARAGFELVDERITIDLRPVPIVN